MVLSVVNDLRQRRLLPVAVLLLVAAVALPLFALKSSAEPAVTPTAGSASTAATPDGLPSPQQALSDKPLVTLAVLGDSSSDLEEFDSKDPFKPIDKVSSAGASDSGSATVAAGTGGTASTDDSSSSGGGSGSGGGSPDTGAGGEVQQPTTTPKSDDNGDNQNSAPKTEKKLTYAVDVIIRGPKGLRRYHSVPKLSLLPAEDNPLLVFLGVEDAGTKAVFLVDAKLKSVAGGEGTCSPSEDQCATLALAPGEEHTLINDAGQTWTIQVAEVRETSVAKAAAAAKAAGKRRARSATRTVGDQPTPRFIPPVITDLFTGGHS
jgi:hypothetical protein